MSRSSSSQAKSPATQSRGSTKAAGPVRSILALAAGASALPLTDPADAAIIVDSSQNNTVIGWNTAGGQTFVVPITLPGGGGLLLRTRATSNGGPYVSISYSGINRLSIFGIHFRFGNGSQMRRKSGFGAYLAPYGGNGAAATGSLGSGMINGLLVYNGNPIPYYNSAFSGPPSKYLLFNFDNSGTTNYGWLEIKALTTGLTQDGKSAFSARLGTLAYDNSGATITAGQTVPVPEPSSAALAMGGALVAGAAGLRRWRNDRATVKGE